MTILRERQTWKRKRTRGPDAITFKLLPAQQVNARAALRELHKHMSRKAIAAAIPCSVKALEVACSAKGKPSPGLAIRTAQLCGVSVDDVLSGAFPKAGHCPRCGWGVRHNS